MDLSFCPLFDDLSDSSSEMECYINDNSCSSESELSSPLSYSPLILTIPEGLITPDPEPFPSPLSPIRTKTPLTHLTPRTPIQLQTPIPQPFQQTLSPIPKTLTPRTPQTNGGLTPCISPNQTPSCWGMKELNESIESIPTTPPQPNPKKKIKRKLTDLYPPTDPRGVQFIPSPKRNKILTPQLPSPSTPIIYDLSTSPRPYVNSYSPYIPDPYLMFPKLKYIDEIEKKYVDERMNIE